MSIPVKENEFALAHGFPSYSALVESSVQLPSDPSSNWFVTGEWLVAVNDEGHWLAWREAGSDGHGPESCPDADVIHLPLAMPTRRRESRKPEGIWPDRTLAH